MWSVLCIALPKPGPQIKPISTCWELLLGMDHTRHSSPLCPYSCLLDFLTFFFFFVCVFVVLENKQHSNVYLI